jgi:hypothetical protein
MSSSDKVYVDITGKLECEFGKETGYNTEWFIRHDGATFMDVIELLSGVVGKTIRLRIDIVEES